MAPQVIILGAGSTGLLIAQGLKKNGIEFVIYEREDEYKYTHHQRDWSMALLWGTNYLQNTLPEGMLERFDEIKSDPHDKPGPDRLGFLPLYNGKTGDLVVKIPGGVAVRVCREKLRKFLADSIDINFGKVCSKIEEEGNKVTVTFADGTTATGDTVVCCDGVKGVGRMTLLGDEGTLSTANCSFVNICNKYTAEQAQFIRGSRDTMYKFAMHPEQPCLFMIVPVDIPDLDKPEEWKYQTCMSTWGATHAETNEERLRVFKERASRFAEPWKSAVEWLPEDTYIPPDQIRYWADPVMWPNWGGKITLAGDCAHPIVPFRAQGLNNALQDAHNYVQALVEVKGGKKSLANAISEYGDEVLERGSAENKLSNMWGPMLHNWEAMMNMPLIKGGYGKKPTIAPATDQEQTKAETAPEKADILAREEQAKIETEEEHPELLETIKATQEAAESGVPTTVPEVTTKEALPASETTSVPEKFAVNSTIVHGLVTPAEEHKSPATKAAMESRAASPSSVFTSPDEELAQLRRENDTLRKRNSLLVEKLKAIENLVATVKNLELESEA